MQQLPPVTRALLIACVAIFCLQQVPMLNIEVLFALWPLQSHYFWPWQIVSYAFLHANPSHLFFNMLGLWMFGVELELLWGTRRFIQFMLASAVAAALCFIVISLLTGSYVPIVGISGSLFGLLLAFGMLFPRRPILLFFVYQTDMRTAVFIFGALQAVLVLFSGGGMSSLSNIAHLGGMLGGYLMILWWRHRPPMHRSKKSPVRRVK